MVIEENMGMTWGQEDRARAGVMVLSPHRDDAAFSCGLLLRHLAGMCVPVHIANVCTVSDYAPYADQHGEPDVVAAITRLRAAEDDAFLHGLQVLCAMMPGCVRQSDLAWKDAPLRLQMATADVLDRRAVLPEEVVRLAKAFRSLPAATVVLAPLALGGHLDHRLVHEAALAAFHRDSLLFFEDLPYACRMPPEVRAQQTETALPWACACTLTPPARSGDKRQAALCYPSQIAPAVADEMESIAATMGWTERLYGSAAAIGALTTLSANR